jgi:hypothetical protein
MLISVFWNCRFVQAHTRTNKSRVKRQREERISLNLMSDIRSKTNPYVHTLQAPYTIVGFIGRFSLLFLGSFRMPISPWKVLQSSSHKRLSSDHLGWVLILRETSPATILGGVSPGSAKCSADHCAWLEGLDCSRSLLQFITIMVSLHYCHPLTMIQNQH